MPERPPGAKAERQDDIQKLQAFIETAAETYRAEGIPIENDGRIDMSAYTGLYSKSDIARDAELNRDWEQGWYNGASAAEAKELRLQNDGERLEMLAQAIFIRNLGPDFVVARSCSRDDRKNKVDTVLLDKTTGNLVCAFDAVGDISGEIYQKKQGGVQERNLKGGASLKYGLGVETKSDGKKKVVPAAVNNIPVFYVALPKAYLDKGLKDFDPTPGKQSDTEKRLFEYFLNAITMQIGGLEVYNNRLNPQLKEKLRIFKTTVGNLTSQTSQDRGKK
jgi:hypothetical protein